MAVEDINANGGVFVEEFNVNIPLHLIVLDDESDPSKTVSHLETEYSDNDVTAYLGVAFALWGGHQQGYEYLFSPFFKSPDLGVKIYEALNDTLPEGERPTRVGVFQEQTEANLSNTSALLDKLRCNFR